VLALRKSGLKRLYLIPVLSKALDVLDLLQTGGQPLSLESIYQQTNISKTTVYRILKTFVHRGYLAQSDDGLYRMVARLKKARFGFGSQSAELPFSNAVTDSLKAAAVSAGVDLVVLDNRYSGSAALHNADEFVCQRVDVVIEFQIDQHSAPIIADRFDGAGIPFIAVDIPHPHAIFFGVNNYRVGFEAGTFMAKHASKVWDGKPPLVLGLDVEEAGPLVQSRITGAFEGLRSVYPDIGEQNFLRLDGRGLREKSYRIVLDFLNRNPKEQRILIVAATDTSALGALHAVQELKGEKHVAIVGQESIPEAIEAMSVPGSPFIGSVSHEAHTYGPRLIQLGLALLNGQRVPPYSYVDHKLVTAASVRGGVEK
jgi:ribose transport system substrate-binding protein